jgi:hypothetical protein
MSEAGRLPILPKPVTKEAVDPLADGELALGVLLGDGLRPAHRERPPPSRA